MTEGCTCPEAGFAPEDLLAVRRKRPLVHCMTNMVSMNLVANAVLAVGGSPVMAAAVEEVEEITAGAAVLLLNIGTITSAVADAMRLAAAVAVRSGIPVVIDPVGAAASSYRRRIVQELMDLAAPAVIRANASEILALAGNHSGGGVDSTHEPCEALEASHGLAAAWKCAVVVSGEVDYVVSEHLTVAISNGSPMMRSVTGMGCVASALTAAFAASCPDRARAAASAMIAAGVAGEIAAGNAKGPGSFQAFFLDALFGLDAARLQEHARLHPVPRDRWSD